MLLGCFFYTVDALEAQIYAFPLLFTTHLRRTFQWKAHFPKCDFGLGIVGSDGYSSDATGQNPFSSSLFREVGLDR